MINYNKFKRNTDKIKEKIWNLSTDFRDGLIDEFIQVIMDLLNISEVQEMKEYIHHGDKTLFDHSIHVAYFNFLFAKFFGLDIKSATRAGLLHDLFLYDWHDHFRETGNMFHGITHPAVSLKNANRICKLNKKEKNIILSHMWPLTLHYIPRCKEAYLTTVVDKVVSVFEKVDQVVRK
ncbi:MAG: phosphohydrolase [Lachnospiraceae bacterium]|jgi:uncharacterized protein|nr:phosphohydrolase [Lachnospiraceae bacterium]